MNRSLPGDENQHAPTDKHSGNFARIELSSGVDSPALQPENRSGGQANLLARWNTQATHLTALEALERYGWSVFPLDQAKNRWGAFRWNAQAASVACLSKAAGEQSRSAGMGQALHPLGMGSDYWRV
jgi:hypothetical protein